MFNICINHLDDGAECTLNKFADDAKMGKVADATERCAAIQKDLSRLEKCTDRNFKKFTKERCKVLYLGRNNLQHLYLLGVPSCKEAWQNSPASRGFKLNMSQ